MKTIHHLIFLFLSFITINCSEQECYEYSCDECSTPEYGTCTKCRNDFKLIDGTCPCSSSGCALCTTGLAGLNICEQCKEGYTNSDRNCVCSISNCEQCAEDGCKKCNSGYYYNETSKQCLKDNTENKIECYDPQCDGCISEEQGACENCKDGYYPKKGECLPSSSYQSCSGLTCKTPIGFSFPYFVLRCQDNPCMVCVGGSLMILSECDNSDICSELVGCLNCLTKDECLICQQGYYLLGGECKKCSKGCSICSSKTNCQVCLSGYELTTNKTCNLTYNFDYNTDEYQTKKNELIKIYYPEEISKPVTTIPIPDTTISNKETDIKLDYKINESTNFKIEILETKGVKIINTNELKIIETTENKVDIKTDINETDKIQIINDKLLINSDKNFIKYYGGLGRYIIQYGKDITSIQEDECNSICSNINCLNCEIKDGTEICTSCSDENEINAEKCNSICSVDKCSSYSLQENNLVCNNCLNGYYLDGDACKIKCQDENCISCPEDGKVCTECNSLTKLYQARCAKNKDFCSSYPQCTYCFPNEECIQCENGFEVNNKKCAKKKNYFLFMVLIIFIVLIIIGVAIYFVCTRKRNNQNIQMNRFSNDQHSDVQSNYPQVQNDVDELYLPNSIRVVLSKDELAEEYETQKKKTSQPRMPCMFCKKKPGNFKCDCGCIVCKDHSELKELGNKSEKYKVCLNCGKMVNKITPIKYFCNICMQNKPSVVHFKCGCSMEVCKNCYIKCKMSNAKCPGCRAII